MKRVLLAGILGACVLVAWLIVVDAILGFRRGIEMRELGAEREVYQLLRQHVTEPGRYVLNPEVDPERGYPGGDPIFAVHYTGLGHADAGQEMLAGVLIAVLSSVTGAWLLRHASTDVLSRYGSRLGFFAAIGLVAVLLGTGARFGLASYPMRSALALGLHDLSGWVVAGLVVTLLVKPSAASDRQ